MSGVLIADIGATNCRFATVGGDGRPHRVMKWRGDAVPSLAEGIAHYLEATGARPRAGVIAIAASLEGDSVTMTNRSWSFRWSDLAKRFGWSAVRGINDFEAVAWSLPHLAAGDMRPLGAPPLAAAAAAATKAALGPGTGLGVAALVPVGAGWQGVASEGGHVSFGPGAADEEAVFARLRAAHGPVSAETMLCGPGLERLFAAMHPAEKPRAAAAIVAGATADDAAAHACLTLFVRLLGRFAGDLALTFKALGGVYIGGGVAPRIAAFLDAPAWRAAFEAHPPYAALLRRIPTLLITHEEPGLLGCAAVARAQGLA